MHSLNAIQLRHLLIELSLRKDMADSLGIDYVLSGYNVDEWIVDIKSRLFILNRSNEEKNLKVMENKLNEMLSNEKKVELELEDIEKML